MKMPPRVPPPPVKPRDARSIEQTGVLTGVTPTTERHALLGLRVLLLMTAPAGIVTTVVVLLHGDRSIAAAIGPLLVVAAFVGARRMFRRVVATRGGRRPPALMPGPGDLEVRKLRLKTFDDVEEDWILYGRTRGGDVTAGDIVRLQGRRRRDGRAVARQVALLGTPSGPLLKVVTARRPLRFLVARLLSQAGYALAGALVVWTVLVLVGVIR
ncbi:hypothetical protein [Dactylosporangium sp. CA-139066]|uniref:hypothetical protein n=1 Tax=Dactylosporangium sp. CA-139066 TaxID=3239930 RepID=UPI003D900FAB